MRHSIVHIIIVCGLLFTYGAERMLPCSGMWDMDTHGHESPCQGSGHDRTVDEAGPLLSHFDPAQPQNDHDDTENHSDHHCACPCHAVAVTSVPEPAAMEAFFPALFPTGAFVLPCSSLPPPDHVPI